MLDGRHREEITEILTCAALVYQMPTSLQLALSAAIGVISKHDFPGQWPELMPYMVAQFQSGNFHMINGVLKTAHSIFKR